MSDIEVTFSGPLFDGRAEEAMRRLVDESQAEVAKAAEDTWQSLMDASFRHPTDKYQSFVIQAVWISFHDYFFTAPTAVVDHPFVGLENYVSAVTDPQVQQSFVNIARRDPDLVVNDGWPESHLPYGPWLEGIGSRNSPVTRFPGYFSLKRAADMVRRDTDGITAPIVDKYVREANS